MNYRQIKRKYNIAFIAQSRFAASLLQSMAPTLGIQLEVHLLAMEQALTTAKELLEDNEVDMIISCGSTAKLLQQHLGSRALHLRNNAIDIMRALQEASQVSRSICLPYYDEIPEGIDILSELLHLRLVPTIFHDTQGLISAITRSIEEGIYCIVGSNIATKIAIAQGAHGFEILFSEEEAKNVLEEAIRLIELQHINKKKEIFINSISDVLSENGIIGFDEDDNIVTCNNTALNILKCKRNNKEIISRLTNNNETIIDKYKNYSTIIHLQNSGNHKLNICSVELLNGKRGFLAVLNKHHEGNDSNKHTSFRSRYTFANMVGSSSAMKNLVKKAKTFANTDAALLIRGETGTGKELLAHAIHDASSRRNAPFVALNCAALSETLLESELFGYESGAFTGARRGGKDGIFSLAQGGTVYLDEIADISPAVQVRLLRVLEAKEIMKVGGDRIIPVDVRVISSSWKNLATEVAEGRFRADLYYRLSVLSLTLPPLRARKEDIPEIITSLMKKHNLTHRQFSEHAMQKMLDYSWPGNIRELDALIQRYCLMLQNKQSNDIVFDEIFSDLMHDSSDIFINKNKYQGNKLEQINVKCNIPLNLKGTLKERIEVCEKEIIRDALIQNSYSKSSTAKQLGISQNTLWRKLKSN